MNNFLNMTIVIKISNLPRPHIASPLANDLIVHTSLPVIVQYRYLSLQRINEKANVVSDYETGRALPNQQIIAKLERVLGKEDLELLKLMLY